MAKTISKVRFVLICIAPTILYILVLLWKLLHLDTIFDLSTVFSFNLIMVTFCTFNLLFVASEVLCYIKTKALPFIFCQIIIWLILVLLLYSYVITTGYYGDNIYSSTTDWIVSLFRPGISAGLSMIKVIIATGRRIK